MSTPEDVVNDLRDYFQAESDARDLKGDKRHE
jgi:hypothetical protein